MRSLPTIGGYIQSERITHRNTVTVDDVKVIFAATDSMKVIIAVQSVQHPEFYTVYHSILEMNQGSHSEDVKKACKKMAKKYRGFYSKKYSEQSKPKKQPTNYTVHLWSLVSSYREILVAYFETVQFQALRQKTSQYDVYRLAMLCKLQVETYLDVYFGKYTQRIKINRLGWVNDLRGNWIYEINTLIST